MYFSVNEGGFRSWHSMTIVIFLAMLSLRSPSPLLAGEKSEGFTEVSEVMNLTIDELLNMKVVTVSNSEEDLDTAPGTTYVFTREMIQRRGHSSLKDLLQITPGVAVFHRDLQYVAMVRGLAANDNEKMTLMINGVEVNQVNEPEFLNGPINLENVKRVEIVVGPSSIYHPANTLVATINVITLNDDVTRISLSSGTEREYATTISHGSVSANGDRLWVSLSLEKRRGFDAWDRFRSSDKIYATAGKRLTGKSGDLDHFLVANGGFGRLNYQITSYRRTMPELRLYQQAPGSQYIDELNGVGFQYDAPIADELTFGATFSAYHKKSVRRTPDFIWQQIEQYDYNGSLGLAYTGVEDHLIKFGIHGMYEDNLDNFFDETGVMRQQFYDENTHGIGLYLDDAVQATDDLQFVVGVCADQNSLVGHEWHWGGRAGGSYRVSKDWTSKLFYNRTVRMPSPLAALNQIWGSDVPTAPVWAAGSLSAEEPEILSAVEWTNIFYTDATRTSVNVYYQELDDFITWGSPHANVGNFKGWGVEVDERYSICNTVSLWANGALNRSKFHTSSMFDSAAHTADAHQAVDDDNRLIGAPMITANIGLDWDLTKNLKFSPAVRYFTRQPVERTYDGGTTTQFDEVNNRYYVDVCFYYRNFLYEGLDLRLSGKNVLDNRDYVALPWGLGEYRPNGRTFEISLFKTF